MSISIEFAVQAVMGRVLVNYLIRQEPKPFGIIVRPANTQS